MTQSLVAATEIVLGLVTLVLGGELLVRGASALAQRLRVSPLIIGLTVVAFGTSSPELAVSLQASLTGSADVAVGNAVGSNIINVLFILGVAALIAPLVVSSQLIRWDVPLMVVASGLLLAFVFDGELNRIEGSTLFALLAVYLAWTIYQSRRESATVIEEFAEGIDSETEALRGHLLRQVLAISAGLAFLCLGSHWLVNGSVTVARIAGVSELVIGLTIVALGTSLPEAVTSVLASARGERDIAVGNIVGSNIFNILAVLGLSAFAAPNGLVVSNQAIAFDIPVMVVVAIACLPVFFTGSTIARWEGGLFLAYYLVYMGFVIMRATNNKHHDALLEVMFVFVIPLTVVTLLVTVIQSWRNRKG